MTERYGLEAEVVYELSAELEVYPRIYTGKIANIGQGGLCLKSEIPLTQSQIIKVSLPVPEVNIASPTLAEVCWVRKAVESKGYWVGLRFLL